MTIKPKKPPRVYPPLPPGAVLLALDVSSSATGWAVARIGDDRSATILDFGVIKAPSGKTSIERTDRMSMGIACLVKKHDPVEICMEFQDHKNTGRRVQGLAVLGQAQGSIRTYLAMTHRVTTVSERESTKVNGKNVKKEIRAEYVKQVVPAYAEAVAANPRFDPGHDGADALNLILFRTNQ